MEIGHTVMEISLNLVDFIDFFLNINGISFYFHFLQGVLSRLLLNKACVVEGFVHKFPDSFFETNAKRSEIKSITESF